MHRLVASQGCRHGTCRCSAKASHYDCQARGTCSTCYGPCAGLLLSEAVLHSHVGRRKTMYKA